MPSNAPSQNVHGYLEGMYPTEAVPFTVVCGRFESVLSHYPDDAFEAVICDPPYGLTRTDPVRTSEVVTSWISNGSVMLNGKGAFGEVWDAGVPEPSLWRQIHRVLKPGGFVFAFAASRTLHLTTLSVELAGFEIRDPIVWFNRQGFPKAADEGVRIDKKLGGGAESGETRKVVNISNHRYADICRGGPRSEVERKVPKITTDLGRIYSDCHANLKPATEYIVFARKALSEGSIAENLIKHRTGALNVRDCRIPIGSGKAIIAKGTGKFLDTRGMGYGFKSVRRDPYLGRYPANLIGDIGEEFEAHFFCPKANRDEKDLYLPLHVKNRHPCAKPVALMRWLSRLACPYEGSLILDPFCGSGSGGIGAVLEGHRYIGIEQDPQHVAIARLRIQGWLDHKSEYLNEALHGRSEVNDFGDPERA